MSKPFAPGVEVFTMLYLQFDIDAARKILEGREAKGQIDPGPGWSPMIQIEPSHAMSAEVDTKVPVIVAQIVLEGTVMPLLIDGHHRNYRASKDGVPKLKAHLLTVAETFKILRSGVPEKLRKMKKEAKALGHL